MNVHPDRFHSMNQRSALAVARAQAAASLRFERDMLRLLPQCVPEYDDNHHCRITCRTNPEVNWEGLPTRARKYARLNDKICGNCRECGVRLAKKT